MPRLIRRSREPSTPAPRIGWDELARKDGRWWLLVAGEDFEQAPLKAARAARQWASNNGFRCSAVQTEDGNLNVKFEKVVISDAH